MSRIKILAVGKIKENYILEGIYEYVKRMKNKRLEIIELKDSTKEEECNYILEKFKKLKGYITISLDEHGKELTSIEFAEFIKRIKLKDIVFIIGGPDGLNKPILDKVDYKISLSRMTLTHEMARLFLIEQIYRAFTIIEGKRYHRE